MPVGTRCISGRASTSMSSHSLNRPSLEATTRLLEELGYDRLRIQDVADRAHVGLATIYRRWPTKQALVIAAMQHRAPFMAPENDDPLADLRALLHAAVDDIWGPRR